MSSITQCSLFCPYNCAGRGICDYTSDNVDCICCNEDDKTPTCENSPIGTNKCWLSKGGRSFDDDVYDNYNEDIALGFGDFLYY